MRLPMQVYSLAKQGNKAAMAFKQMYGNQPGEYQEGLWEQFKSQYENGDVSMNTDFEEDLEPKMTPEESRANEAIEGYVDKYKTEMDAASEKNAIDLAYDQDEEMRQANNDVDWWERDDNADEYPEANARPNENKLLNKLEEYASDEDYKEQALNAIQWNGNWSVADRVRKDELLGSSEDYDYDSKSDEEISDDYYAAVEDGMISGKDAFETMIGDMSDDSVGEYMHEYGFDEDYNYEDDLEEPTNTDIYMFLNGMSENDSDVVEEFAKENGYNNAFDAYKDIYKEYQKTGNVREARDNLLKNKSQKQHTQEEYDDNYESDLENNNVSYGDLVRYSAEDDSPEYRLAKKAIVNNGRGLAKRLSRSEEFLSPDDIELKNAIIKSAKPSKWDMTLYRTDDTNWLKDAKVGALVDQDLYIGGSLDKNMTIEENQGNVKQKIQINIKKGNPILTANNANEQEVDLVKNNSDQFLKVVDIKKDENGIPTYIVEVAK